MFHNMFTGFPNKLGKKREFFHSAKMYTGLFTTDIYIQKKNHTNKIKCIK